MKSPKKVVVVLCEDEGSMKRRPPKPGDRCANENCPNHEKDIPLDSGEVIEMGGKVYCDDFCCDEWTVGD